MSFSDAVGQIDQIVQWEQQMANPATLTQASSTTGTSATSPSDSSSATSASSFADTLAEAQANTEASTATSVLDPSSTTDSTDPTDSTSALLGGGDSQLLTALQSMEASTSTGSTDSADSAASVDSLSALDTTDSLDDAASTGSSDSTELADLASAAGQSSATTGATAGTTGAITATNSANVTDTTTSGVTGGQATNSSDPRILAMTEEANGLVGKPYVWGGGHDGWGSTKGYDCSGFVSAVLHAGGYLSSPQDTATLPSAGGMEQGPGQYVTIYDRDTPGQEGHVIISINGQFYESGGEHGTWGGGGGVEEISTPSASYLATFNNVLHPAGL
jgi:cell wall-associated NlpC family hydrolase